jgi:ATP-dependent DNA helicase RecQ
MGIDKPHLPFVFHFEVSDSVDSYYQEVGRGGRDGEPAQAVLLYRAEDLALRRFFAGGSADEPAQQKLDKSRVEMMRAYAETRGCRRQFILSYFGEPFDPPCGNCDNCEAGFISPDVEIDTPFQVNRRVRHQEWGEGSVVRLEDTDKLTVLFDQVGYKVLSLVLLKENGLLRLSE